MTSPSSVSANRPPSRSPGVEFRTIKAQWAKAQAMADTEASQAQAQLAQAEVQGKIGPGGCGSWKSSAADEEELFNALKERDEQRNKIKEREFKLQHLGILGLLGWIL